MGTSLAADAPAQTGLRSIWRLIVSDYRAGYAYKGESESRMRLLMLPRLLTNASLHANILVRLMVGSPRWMSYVWRRILISSHSCDIARDITIGPGLQLPHPFGIAIGANSHIGARVCIHHGVSIGPTKRRWIPGHTASDATVVIGAGAVLFPYCQVLAVNKVIGVGAQIGALQIVTDDVPAGAIFVRGEVRLPSNRKGDDPAVQPPSSAAA